MTAYQEELRRSLADPSSYWPEPAGDVQWYKAPQQGIDTSQSPCNTWFADREINDCSPEVIDSASCGIEPEPCVHLAWQRNVHEHYS